MKAKATKRAMARAIRVVSIDTDDGNGNKVGRQARAMRAMAAATAVVGKDEGDGNSNEGGWRGRG